MRWPYIKCPQMRNEDRETQKEGGLPWREEGRLETPELGRQEGPSPLEPQREHGPGTLTP